MINQRSYVAKMMEELFQKVNIKTPETEEIMKNIYANENNLS